MDTSAQDGRTKPFLQVNTKPGQTPYPPGQSPLSSRNLSFKQRSGDQFSKSISQATSKNDSYLVNNIEYIEQ